MATSANRPVDLVDIVYMRICGYGYNHRNVRVDTINYLVIVVVIIACPPCIRL